MAANSNDYYKGKQILHTGRPSGPVVQPGLEDMELRLEGIRNVLPWTWINVQAGRAPYEVGVLTVTARRSNWLGLECVWKDRWAG
jgi:hypothetical protein